MDNSFNLSSAASSVIGVNLLGAGVSIYDFQIENSNAKLLNRVPAKILHVDSDVSILDGFFPLFIVARGERITASVFAREGLVYDETDIIFILK